jgi:hypothetical protein
MNERILELMAQAGIDVEKLRTYPGGWPREDLLVLEDFAKLIVQECADAIIKDSRLSDVRSAANGCVRTIREHFGVEA